MQITACECPASGWCERHHCLKSAWLWETCRRHPALFALWEQGAGPGQRAARAVTRREPCRQRGAVLRLVECESCRGRVQLKVFACAIQGECVLSGQGAGLVDCARCPQYECGEEQGACDA